MGFKKANLETIAINMNVKTVDEKDNMLMDVMVTHVFALPSPAERERWNKEVVQQKGRKIEASKKSTANWNLWLACVKSVEGYDDLDTTKQDWKKYFADNIGRIHVDNAVDILMEMITSDQAGQEKKLELSSEQSSSDRNESILT
jgi:hypothetical protein